MVAELFEDEALHIVPVGRCRREVREPVVPGAVGLEGI